MKTFFRLFEPRETLPRPLTTLLLVYAAAPEAFISLAALCSQLARADRPVC